MNITEKRKRIRYSIKRANARYRLSVNKTNQYLSAQLIDLEDNGKILGSVHQKTFKTKATKPVEIAAEMGESFGKEISGKKIESIVFDRSGYIYHGKIKAFADGLRKGGLKF